MEIVPESYVSRKDLCRPGDAAMKYGGLIAMQSSYLGWFFANPHWSSCARRVRSTLTIGGHRVGHYSAQGKLLTPLTKKQIKAVEKTCAGKVQKQTFPPPLRRLLDDFTFDQTGHFIC
jgi:hypothetical protein